MRDRFKDMWEHIEGLSPETLNRIIDGIYEEASESFRFTDDCRQLEAERNSLLAWRCPTWYKKRHMRELDEDFRRKKERFLCKFAVLRYLELTGQL